MGILDLVGEQRVGEHIDAGRILAVQIKSWDEALDVSKNPIVGTNRFIVNTQLGSIIFSVLMPLVYAVSNGDDNSLSKAIMLLRRYVRTPDWYRDDVDLSSFRDTDDFDEGEYEYESDEEEELELARRNKRPRNPLQSRLQSDEQLSSEDDEKRETYSSRQRMKITRAAPTLLINENYPDALVESCVVCAFLGLLNVMEDDYMTNTFYTEFLDIVKLFLESRNKDEKYISLANLTKNLTFETIMKRHRRVLQALKWRVATHTLYDMWTVFDVTTNPPFNQTQFNNDEKRTLRAMASALVMYADIDDYLSTRNPWITAAAIALVMAEFFHDRETLTTSTVEFFSDITWKALKLIDLSSKTSNTSMRNQITKSIIQRADLLRQEFLNFTNKPGYKIFTNLFARPDAKDIIEANYSFMKIGVQKMRSNVDLVALEEELRLRTTFSTYTNREIMHKSFAKTGVRQELITTRKKILVNALIQLENFIKNEQLDPENIDALVETLKTKKGNENQLIWHFILNNFEAIEVIDELVAGDVRLPLAEKTIATIIVKKSIIVHNNEWMLKREAIMTNIITIESPTMMKLIIDTTTQNEYWLTFIKLTIMLHKPTMLKFLLTNFQVNSADILSVHKDIIKLAIVNKNIDIIKLLIDVGVQLDDTLLLYAVSKNDPNNINDETKSIDIVKLLLQKNLNVNVTNTSGDSVVLHAIRFGNIELVKLLVDSGANVYAINNYEKNALYYAIYSKKYEMVKYILRQYNIPVTYEHVVLSIEFNQNQILRMLINDDILHRINQKNGYTLLHVAAEHNYDESLQVLLNLNVDPDIVDYSWNSALDLAIENHSTDCAKLLLQKQTYIRYISLIDIVKMYSISLLQLFIDRRRNDDIIDPVDVTKALQLACYGRNYEMVELLIQQYKNAINEFFQHQNFMVFYYFRRATTQSMPNISTRISLRCIDILLKNDITMDITMIVENLNVFTTIEDRAYYLLELIVKRNEFVYRNVLFNGLTPLQLAAQIKDKQSMKILLEHGANNDELNANQLRWYLNSSSDDDDDERPLKKLRKNTAYLTAVKSNVQEKDIVTAQNLLVNALLALESLLEHIEYDSIDELIHILETSENPLLIYFSQKELDVEDILIKLVLDGDIRLLLCETTVIKLFRHGNMTMEKNESLEYRILEKAIRTNSNEITRYLIDLFIDDGELVFGDQALFEASANGNLDIVKYLVNNKNVDIRVSNNASLYVAVAENQLDVVKYFLSIHPEDVHWENEALLIKAINRNYVEMTKYLIIQGADTSRLNPKMQILLASMIPSKQSSVVVHDDTQQPPPPPSVSIVNASQNIVNIRGDDEETLISAVKNGDVEAVQTILSQTLEWNKSLVSALNIANNMGNDEISSILMTYYFVNM